MNFNLEEYPGEHDYSFCRPHYLVCDPHLKSNVAGGLLGLAVGAWLDKFSFSELAKAHLTESSRIPGFKREWPDELERIERWLGYPLFENLKGYEYLTWIDLLFNFAASRLNKLPGQEKRIFWEAAFRREFEAMNAIAEENRARFLRKLNGMEEIAPRWIREGEEPRQGFRPPEGEGWTGPIWEDGEWALAEGWKNGWYFLWGPENHSAAPWEPRKLSRWAAYRGQERRGDAIYGPTYDPAPNTFPCIKFNSKGLPCEAGMADLKWILTSRIWTEEELEKNKSWICRSGPGPVLNQHDLELPVDPRDLSESRVYELLGDGRIREFFKAISRKGDVGETEFGGEVVLGGLPLGGVYPVQENHPDVPEEEPKPGL